MFLKIEQMTLDKMCPHMSLVGKGEVEGSNPFGSTISKPRKASLFGAFIMRSAPVQTVDSTANETATDRNFLATSRRGGVKSV